MSKRKPVDEAPAHIAEWDAANPFDAADAFADRVRQDARADVAMGRPIEDAQLIARGLAVSSGGSKGAEASKKTRQGPESKRAAILAAAAKYGTPNSAQVAAIARSTGSTARWVREVLGLKKTEG